MTRTYFVERKADDLKTGNMFVSWAKMLRGEYPIARRITGLMLKKGVITVFLDDCNSYKFDPDHVVIVEEFA